MFVPTSYMDQKTTTLKAALKVTNKEMLERENLPSMWDLLIRKNIRWTGHVIVMRMPSERLPKQIRFYQLSADERAVGRPRLRYKDTINQTEP